MVPGAIGPRQDLIVGRISGGGADRTAVFAGMSGSPVYIDGRLVGAISYSFPFSKEPICGITPIEQMISIFERKQPARAASGAARRFLCGACVDKLEARSSQAGLHRCAAGGRVGKLRADGGCGAVVPADRDPDDIYGVFTGNT